MKEFERISGLKIAEVKKDRIAALRTFVKEYDVTCVLKDSRTTIAKPRERVAVNLSGCAAMAKAGSGDVLAGSFKEVPAFREYCRLIAKNFG